jgi:2-iminobutanoate/2-iminopropanoate deaminase
VAVKEVINPEGMWNATPRSYSHVVKVTNPQSLIFVAGMASVSPEIEVIGRDDIEVQTRTTFENIRTELDAAGASMSDIVDMTVYLVDIRNHQWPVRKVREEFFAPEELPVSTMIGVAELALDGLLIEIDVIAAI